MCNIIWYSHWFSLIHKLYYSAISNTPSFIWQSYAKPAYKTEITIGWLVYNAHSVLELMQICILSLKVYLFSDQGNQIPIKTDGLADPASRAT